MAKNTHSPLNLPEGRSSDLHDLRGAKLALRHLKSKKASKTQARATLICELFEDITAARAGKVSWADIADTLAAAGNVALSAIALSKGFEEEKKRRLLETSEVPKVGAQSDAESASMADAVTQRLTQPSVRNLAQGGR